MVSVVLFKSRRHEAVAHCWTRRRCDHPSVCGCIEIVLTGDPQPTTESSLGKAQLESNPPSGNQA